MNSSFRKSVLVATMAATAIAGTTSLAFARDNCVSYARLTLQQAKQNVDRRCNFTGPRWSLDAAKHRAWCKEVGPAAWRAELKIRNKMLAGCK